MYLNPIASNMTEIATFKYRILCSYKTPVAVYDLTTNVFVKTKKFWSRTTSRHINKWIGPFAPSLVHEEEQEFFDDLLEAVR